MSWEVRNISELCVAAIDCVNKTAPTVEYETPFKMLRTTNVKGGFIDFENIKYVSEETFQKWTRRLRPQYGDVILTREAPVGEVGRFTSNESTYFLGQRLFHYRPNPKFLDWNFLAYVLQSHEIQGKLKGMGFGATVDHIRVGDAENLLIPCPPVEVQRRIGDVLGNYDDFIENNRKRISLYEEAAKLIYQQWFIHFRFPGYEKIKLANGIPENWQMTELGQITTLEYGKGLTEENRREGTVPVYGSSGIVGSHDKFLIDGAGIIVGRKGNVGSVFWSAESFWPIDTVYYISPKDSDLYLFHALCTMTFQNNDVAVPGLNRNYAHSRKLVIPDNEIKHAFLEIVGPIYEQIAVLSKLNTKLQAEKDLILPRLMSGEISV